MFELLTKSVTYPLLLYVSYEYLSDFISTNERCLDRVYFVKVIGKKVCLFGLSLAVNTASSYRIE